MISNQLESEMCYLPPLAQTKLKNERIKNAVRLSHENK